MSLQCHVNCLLSILAPNGATLDAFHLLNIVFPAVLFLFGSDNLEKVGNNTQLDCYANGHGPGHHSQHELTSTQSDNYENSGTYCLT